MDVLAEALERERADRLVELARGSPRRASSQPRAADAAEHLAAVPVRQQLVAQRRRAPCWPRRGRAPRARCRSSPAASKRCVGGVGLLARGASSGRRAGRPAPRCARRRSRRRRTKTWSSSRRRPSGKRRPCSSRKRRRNSLCGVSSRSSRRSSNGTPCRLAANSARGTRLPWPTTLPITMSASVLHGRRVQALERVALEPVVVVDEVDVVAARPCRARRCAACRASRSWGCARPHVPVRLGQRVQPRGRRVGGPVVDEDQLELLRAAGSGRAATRCSRRCAEPGL